MNSLKICLVVALTWGWWVYLALHSQMLISGDAIGYQNLGNLFYHGDWGTYFITGPNREPGYPLLVALSMRVADWFHLDQLTVLKFMQLFLLACTQLFVWTWLCRLGVSVGGTMLAVGYIGFSPALLNAALSMYSARTQSLAIIRYR